MSRGVKVGIVGTGDHMVRSHLEYLSRDSRVEIVAACDPNSEALQRISDRFAIPSRHSDHREMFASDGLDAVVISSPDRFHASEMLDAVNAGLHTFVEKPLADSSNALAQMRDAFEQTRARGLVLMSCHPRRFDPPFVTLKELLPGLIAELGAVIALRFDFSYHRPSERKSGLHHGLLIDHVNHEVDLLSFLFGHQRITAHRVSDSQIRYFVCGQREDDGIEFSFSGTRMLEESIFPEFVELRFERGTLTIDTYTGVAQVKQHGKDARNLVRLLRTDYEQRFLAVNLNFIDAILGTAKPYLTLAEMEQNTCSGLELTESGFFCG